MKIRAFHLFLAVTICFSVGFTTTYVQAQGCSDYTAYLGWRSRAMPPVTSYVSGVIVEGNWAYVAAAGAGLAVYDVSDPANPVLQGMADTPYACRDVAIDGDYAYVADWHSPGFCVIDVSDPSSPDVVGSEGWTSNANYWKVAVAKPDTVFVVDYYYGVRVIDVAEPTTPDVVGLIPIAGYAWDLDVHDQHLYVVDDVYGLYIFDIGMTTLFPGQVGYVDLPDYCAGVHVVGNYAYVVCADDGLQVIDVWDKENPEVVGVWGGPEPDTNFSDVHVVDNLAYIVCNEGGEEAKGLLIVNVEDPSAPFLVNSLGTYFNNQLQVFVADDHAYVAAREKGFFVADVTNPRSPGFFSSFAETDYRPLAVEARGDFAYVLDSVQGLRVFDITTTGAATLVGNQALPGAPRQIVLSGELAFVAAGDGGLQVIDISVPTSPGITGSVNPAGSQMDVAVQGDFAYLASDDWGLRVVDVSNPALPVERGYVDPAFTDALAVEVLGDYAYLACDFEGLFIIDITNPDSPSEVGHIPFEGDAANVHLARGHAFVSGYEDGVFVVDISDPTDPTLVSTFVTPGYALDVIVDGNLAYIADHEGGLQIADFTDLANPRYLGCMDTPNQRAQDIALVDHRVCVADWHGGFHVLPQHCVPTGVPDGDLPPPTVSMTAYPNPFNPQTTFSFNLERSEAVRITVFSTDGRPVRLIADRAFPAGPNTATWNGRDDRGRKVPSGAYLVRMETGSGLLQSKVTLLK